ncbi:elongation of very long chain fatty acids protein 7 [Condylostylus longicornis]|uniref:elongation of very long chain fatty acids protein 7 n=1 Tax=Condylostylus longicornis TaxID=2530218 RepID=UPI00244DCACF|nr:elongation of very long chain fatty acids protein 7 [Condylostylus longicornis]
MSSLVESLQIRYAKMSEGIDPTIDNWLLMKSPTNLLIIIALYLVFVLRIGPSFMANRKPYNLQPIMVGYNAYQVIFNIWMFLQAFNAERSFAQILSNTCKSETDIDRVAQVTMWSGAWWYFFSKVIDLLDTVFFVLRKKQNQVTFLHVYHHTITALFSWCYLKYLPGEQGVVIGLLNSFVHIIMYFYYMLAAMGPKYQKYLWWKKYMTVVQLIQFCLMLTYLTAVFIMDCNLPRSLTYFFGINVIIFLYLFGGFYRNAYSKKSEKIKSDEPSKNNLLANGDQLKQMINECDKNNNETTKKFV